MSVVEPLSPTVFAKELVMKQFRLYKQQHPRVATRVLPWEDHVVPAGKDVFHEYLHAPNAWQVLMDDESECDEYVDVINGDLAQHNCAGRVLLGDVEDYLKQAPNGAFVRMVHIDWSSPIVRLRRLKVEIDHEDNSSGDKSE